MAVTGISPGDYFSVCSKMFFYPGDVNGNQVILDVLPTTTPLDVFIVRPDNTAYTPTIADNGNKAFELNQDIYVSYPDGRREIYRYDGTQPQLIDTWNGDDGERSTVWVVSTPTINTWANPGDPSNAELTAAYEAIVPEDKRVIGDILRMATSGQAYMLFDAENNSQKWFPTNLSDSDPVDSTSYIVSTGTSTRDVAPVPADVGAVEWSVGSRIEKVLSTGIVEIYQANTRTTSNILRVQLPTEPFTSHPSPSGWKSGEIYRYLDTSGGVTRVQRFRWITQAGTLVAYEILGSAS